MKFSIFQLSRIGDREQNEDRIGYCYTRDAVLLVLADGMGGHPDGQVAAQTALETLSARFQTEARPSLADVPGFLASALMSAHHEIVRYASRRALTDTPRTTLVAALLQGNQLHWIHCGDSRLYVLRQERLLTRTRDHSYLEAQNQVGASVGIANRNVLYTCLGSVVRPMFDPGGPLQLEPGDKLLLCSDGLWDGIDEPALVETLSALPVAGAVPALVGQALIAAKGHSDNVSAIALEWEASEAAGADSALTHTEQLDDDGFSSTIQVGDWNGSASSLDELDEQAIERSIAEINAAIARSNSRHR